MQSVTGFVLTVPMRNGNKDFLIENNMINNSSYRTYEEWKRVIQYSYQ